jgi:hypothetical protein
MMKIYKIIKKYYNFFELHNVYILYKLLIPKEFNIQKTNFYFAILYIVYVDNMEIV